MKKAFKFVSLILAAMLLAASFAGCGRETDTDGVKQNDSSSDKGAEAGKGAKNNDGSTQKVILDIFPDLWPEKMHESLEKGGVLDNVEFRETPQNQYENKIRMMIAGGEIGDLICIDAPNISFYANMGAIEPLNDYWEQDDFNDLVPSAQTAMQWKGKIWAAPLNESNIVLFYNKEMFEEAGITAAKTVEEAWTFEKVLNKIK